MKDFTLKAVCSAPAIVHYNVGYTHDDGRALKTAAYVLRPCEGNAFVLVWGALYTMRNAEEGDAALVTWAMRDFSERLREARSSAWSLYIDQQVQWHELHHPRKGTIENEPELFEDVYETNEGAR